jgi:hypothetical protein
METKIEQKTDAQKLQEWIQTISVGQYRITLDNLIKACKIRRYTLQNWRYGNCSIPELAKDKIEEIAGVKIF